MKKLILSMVLVLSSVTAQAAVVNSVTMNEKEGVIELSVSYGGGCAEHNFSLKVGACRETHPVQCDAELVDSGKDDSCRAFITETVKIDLRDAELDGDYYSRASLTINGDAKSSVNVTLPDTSKKEEPKPVKKPTVNSPTVEGARLNLKEAVIEVDVSYGGGCLDHTFKLQMGGCFESMPVGCTLTVVDTTKGLDACEAFITETVKFSLREYGLNESYYSGAGLSIVGAGDSRASVTLPLQ